MKPGSDRIVKRIYATGVWRSASALHVGGDPEPGVPRADMTLLRSAAGEFYIPGSSIAGAGRSALTHRAPSHLTAIDALFGARCTNKRAPHFASPLVVSDAPARSALKAVIRDGVQIAPSTGIAADGAKFNLEVLPAGAEFHLRLCLNLYAEAPGRMQNDDLRRAFHTLLDTFSAPDGVSLGARTRRGYGAGCVKAWTLREFDTDRREDVLAWLRGDPNGGRPVTLDVEPYADERKAFSIDAVLRVQTSLLIRSAGERLGDPDQIHITENGRPLLTGTSVGGALRSRCGRIAKTLGLPADRVAAMFGTEAAKRNDPKTRLCASRVTVKETPLHHGTLMVQGRVAIDRFTQAAKDSALFDEAPFWPGDGSHVQLSIRLEDPNPGEAGLLLAALKDLWLGDLPLGGETGLGRGTLRGVSAIIRAEDGARWQLMADGDDFGRVRVEGDQQALEKLARLENLQ